MAVTLICTFEANGCLPLLKLTPFNGIHSALLKDHVDLQKIVRKEQRLKMLKSFLDNSPKVSTPEDFVIYRTAMLWIITTFGFVDAVSC